MIVCDDALRGFDIPMTEQRYLGYTLGENPEAFAGSRKRMADWFRAHRN